MDYTKIYTGFYTAALLAIDTTGDAYKKLAWFPRNKTYTKPLN